MTKLSIGARLARVALVIAIAGSMLPPASCAQSRKNASLSQEQKDDFEKNVQSLLYISSDGNDVFDPHGKTIRSINIEGRKKYFSENGWQEYVSYLSARQEALKKDMTLATHSKTESGSIKRSTPRYYTDENGNEVFESDITFSQTSYDVASLGSEKSITLMVSFQPSNDNASIDPTITGWKMRQKK